MQRKKQDITVLQECNNGNRKLYAQTSGNLTTSFDYVIPHDDTIRDDDGLTCAKQAPVNIRDAYFVTQYTCYVHA